MRFPPTLSVFRQQVACRTFRIAQRALLVRQETSNLNWQIALPEIGQGIVVGIQARDLVRSSTHQMKLKLALLGLGNYNRILRQCEL